MNFLVSSPRDVSYRVFSPGDLGAEKDRGPGTSGRVSQPGEAPPHWACLSTPVAILHHLFPYEQGM